MNLTDKVALITGGTRMGLPVSQALSQQGCQIILTWRNSKAQVEAAVKTLQQSGVQASAIQCDLSDQGSIENLARLIESQHGRLDILVNMASVYEKGSLRGLWKAHRDLDLQSAVKLIPAVLPLLDKAKEGGRIVLFSDWLAASGRPRYADYGAYYLSKAGLKAYTEALALELAPKILVNAIAPGPILPPDSLSKEEYQEVEKATPLKRWGGPEEIAKTVRFLIETDFITGETIRVDGGRHLY